MSIPVVCAGCSARLNAPDAAAGKSVRCPKCQARVVVPAPAPAFEVVGRTDIEVDDEPVRPRRRREPDGDDRPRRRGKRRPAPAGPPAPLLVGLGVLALAGVGFGVYWFGLRDRGPAAETAQAGPPAPNPAAIPQPGPAPAPGPADPPPDPAADARLGPFQDVAGYEVRPPLGYALVPPPATARAGQTPTGWAGQRRADGTIPSLTMLVVHAPLPEVAGRSAEEFLTSMLDGIKRRRSGWQQSAAEPVTVNGLPMFRVTWSGTDTATGRAMRGFVYAGKHDGRFVQVAGQDLDPGHEADLALVEAAARTLRKK